MKRHKPKPFTWAITILAVVAGIAVVFFSFSAPPAATKVYFLKGEKLFAVSRPSQTLQSAINDLLKGPIPQEEKSGIFTEIPDRTKLRGAEIAGETAVLDFSKEIGGYGGGTAKAQGLIAQIVYTATEIKGIKKVKILIEGKEASAFGGEGLMIDRPLSREDIQF